MLFNVLINAADVVNYTATTSCKIYGAEVADTKHPGIITGAHADHTVNNITYMFVQASVATVMDVNGFLNNYDQFYYVPSTSAIKASDTYTINNRKIEDGSYDGKYPYACYGLPVNAGVSLFKT